MVIDTNILIFFSKGDVKIKKILLDTKEVLYISRINYIEFLADTKLTKSEREKAQDFLLKNFTIIDINQQIADEAIKHRLKSNLKLPDTIIVATAALLNQKLLTCDKQIQKAFPKLVTQV